MHIVIIRPSLCGARVLDALPPLAVGILAAYTPPHIKVTFVDDALGEMYRGPKPDLVAITVQTFSALRAYDLARGFRDQGVPVALGGFHPTLMPDEASKYADAVIIGDAEPVWANVIHDVEQGTLQRVYQSSQEQSLNTLRIDRTIFVGKRYPNIELIWFTRGCRFSCDFCAIKGFYPNVRTRPLHEFATELETLNKRSVVFVVDDNIYATPRLFKQVLATLCKAQVRWVCQISIDVARDEQLVREMALSGCIMVTIGFESLEPDTLRQIGKRWNHVAGSYKEVVARFHRYGIGVYGTFVFGYDTDTLSSIERALEFTLTSKMEIANFNPLTPMPGSRLYHRLIEEGRMLRPQWWLDCDYRYGDPIFVPKQMDAYAFSAKCYEAKSTFYSWKSIVQRILFSEAEYDWTRTRTMLLANAVSHYEIARKQHKTLGGLK